MNKLTALHKLGSAFHSLSREGNTLGDVIAQDELATRFHYIRRSLTLADLKPQPKCTEGTNGRGPTWL